MIFLDTHIVVWLYAGLLGKISKIAVQQIENNELLISQMVRLELQYLYEIGQITATPETIIESLKNSLGLKISDMKSELVFDYAMDFNWTRDVFDRIITAEANALGFSLITKDKTILANYRNAIW